MNTKGPKQINISSVESPVFNSILYDDLRPWLIDFSDIRSYTEIIKQSAIYAPDTPTAIKQKLLTLISGFPETRRAVLAESIVSDNSIQKPSYDTQLSKPNDIPTQFFHVLITTERIRIYNLLIASVSKFTNDVDVTFEVTLTLRSIANQTKRCCQELRNLQASAAHVDEIRLTNFALSTLKWTLIALYFDIQTMYRPFISQPVDEAAFFLLILNEAQPDTSILKLVDSPVKEAEKPAESITAQTISKRRGRQQSEITESMKVVTDMLSFMAGNNPHGRKIMVEADYKRMMAGINRFLETDKVTPEKSKIVADIPANFIRYTFFKIANQLSSTNRPKQGWIDLLHALYTNFQTASPSTTSKKFSEKPASYDADLKALKK